MGFRGQGLGFSHLGRVLVFDILARLEVVHEHVAFGRHQRELMVQSLGFRVQASGVRVQGAGS